MAVIIDCDDNRHERACGGDGGCEDDCANGCGMFVAIELRLCLRWVEGEVMVEVVTVLAVCSCPWGLGCARNGSGYSGDTVGGCGGDCGDCRYGCDCG